MPPRVYQEISQKSWPQFLGDLSWGHGGAPFGRPAPPVSFKNSYFTLTIGEKDNKLFGMGCGLFWRLALFDEKRNINVYLKDENIFKKLTEFEDTQKRKRKPPSSSMLRSIKTVSP